jgi:hypothetical protein
VTARPAGRPARRATRRTGGRRAGGSPPNAGTCHLPAQCLTAETAELLEREADRLGQRIDCLSRNRDAILGYLAAVRGTL